MKYGLSLLLVVALLMSCGNKRNVPDVSGVKVELQLQRFDHDFFSMDTNNIQASLNKLNEKYPRFLPDFLFNILALPAQHDSIQSVENGIKSFIASYAILKDSSDKLFNDFNKEQKEVAQGFKFVKYYFPEYKLPNKLITFIGPFNSYGNILTADALAVGLQLYMGLNFSWYQSQAGQELYPSYVSRRFERDYIPVNCIRNIVDDMYPDQSGGRPLIEQMIEAGKRLYLLDQFLPNTSDTLKTGYTAKQLEGCYDNESMIWGFFLQNDLLYATDPAITKDYMNDAPKTPVLGEGSPGFIGQFVGWQIVKKWMEKNDKTTLQQLMDMPAKTIFEQAKYKPR